MFRDTICVTCEYELVFSGNFILFVLRVSCACPFVVFVFWCFYVFLFLRLLFFGRFVLRVVDKFSHVVRALVLI